MKKTILIENINKNFEFSVDSKKLIPKLIKKGYKIVLLDQFGPSSGLHIDSKINSKATLKIKDSSKRIHKIHRYSVLKKSDVSFEENLFEILNNFNTTLSETILIGGHKFFDLIRTIECDFFYVGRENPSKKEVPPSINRFKTLNSALDYLAHKSVNFILWGTDKCGGTRHLFILANGLAKKGHKVKIISLGSPQQRWFKFHDTIAFSYPERKFCLEIPNIGGRSLIDLTNKILSFVKFPYQLDKTKFLAEHIPWADFTIATYYPTVYSTFMARKGNLCYYIQHYEPIFTADRLEFNLADATYLLPFKKFAVSKWLVNLIGEKSNSKVTYTGAGIDLDIFKEVAKTKENTILGIFRRIEWKGGRDLIKSFQIIHEKMPEVKFKLIGIRKDIEKTIQEIGATFEYEILYGKNNQMLNDFEMAQAFSEAQIFLFTSHLEGFGSPPLEAMACGTPCVIANSKGLIDFAKHNYNSFIVPVKNPQLIAQRTIKLLKDKKLYNLFKKNGLKTVKKFTWNYMIERLDKGLK